MVGARLHVHEAWRAGALEGAAHHAGAIAVARRHAASGTRIRRGRIPTRERSGRAHQRPSLARAFWSEQGDHWERGDAGRSPYTVVGVTPPRFDFFPHADLLTPLA